MVEKVPRGAVGEEEGAVGEQRGAVGEEGEPMGEEGGAVEEEEEGAVGEEGGAVGEEGGAVVRGRVPAGAGYRGPGHTVEGIPGGAAGRYVVHVEALC